MTLILRYFLLASFFCALFACEQKKEEPIDIVERVLYPDNELSELFRDLMPPTQSFTINGKKDTIVIGKNGTRFTIPKNTFINSEGETPSTLQLEIVEVNSISEIIRSNLQTTAGDRVLQTGGMFFIDAKEEKNPLQIAQNKSIYVEVSTNYKDPRMKIFKGNFDDNGKINWAKQGTLENTLIPIPLRFFDINECAFECVFSENQIKELSNPKFENTYIATREFEERLCAIVHTTCSHLNGRSQKILDIYTTNIDNSLYYADSLVVEYFEKNLKNEIDTTKKFTWTEGGWSTYLYQSFTSFKEERLANVINFEKLGIDEHTSVENLVLNGISETDAEKYIAFFKQREQILKTLDAKTKISELRTYSFSINELGWVNVDKFLDDKNTEPSTFWVKLNSVDSLDFTSVSLVIPSYNVALFPIANNEDVYSFTKKEDGYRKLPVGEDAILVGFSYKDEKPYFGKKKIQIPRDGELELSLFQTSELSIIQDINNLTK